MPRVSRGRGDDLQPAGGLGGEVPQVVVVPHRPNEVQQVDGVGAGLAFDPVCQGPGVGVGVQRHHPVVAQARQGVAKQDRDGRLADAPLGRGDRHSPCPVEGTEDPFDERARIPFGGVDPGLLCATRPPPRPPSTGPSSWLVPNEGRRVGKPPRGLLGGPFAAEQAGQPFVLDQRALVPSRNAVIGLARHVGRLPRRLLVVPRRCDRSPVRLEVLCHIPPRLGRPQQMGSRAGGP